MTRWAIETNIGYGWEQVYWAGSFGTEEGAWDFIYGEDPTDTTRWDGQVRAFEIEEEEEDE